MNNYNNEYITSNDSNSSGGFFSKSSVIGVMLGASGIMLLEHYWPLYKPWAEMLTLHLPLFSHFLALSSFSNQTLTQTNPSSPLNSSSSDHDASLPSPPLSFPVFFLTWFLLSSSLFLLLSLLRLLRRALFLPLDIFRPHVFKKSALSRARAIQAAFPSSYPNGWFRLIDSSSLLPGQVAQVSAFGHQIVVFRTSSGAPAALDAYCPHLGANLAVSGTVVGETVRCPFHGWQFDATGKCTHIPYTSKPIPEAARVAAWQVVEQNGSVYCWRDAEGRPPHWKIPVIAATLYGGDVVYHGRTVHHVEAHFQEIPENGADVAHLGVLHVPLIVEWLGKLLSLEHSWTATWEKGGPGMRHTTDITLTQAVSFRGREIGFTVIPVEIHQIGPGIVHLHFDTPFGRCFVVECVTPLGMMLQQCSHIVFAERRVPRWFAKFVLRGLVIQFERDIPIWNNKTYVSKPLLVQGDGKINQFRRWYSQFYSNPDAAAAAASSFQNHIPQDQIEW